MERKFTDISNQVDEIYDGFYDDAKQMLWIAERDIPDKVFCKEPLHETDPTGSDSRERVLFHFTAHKGETIDDCKQKLKELRDMDIFRTDTRFSTVHRGTTYCIGVFAEER